MKLKFFFFRVCSLGLVGALLLASCGFPQPSGSGTATVDPLLTLVEQTVSARRTANAAAVTQVAEANPSPVGPTNTPRPTNTRLVIATDTFTPRPPTATPLVSDTLEPTISDYFFEDDFEHFQIWPTVDRENFSMGYSNGAYRISVKMFTGDSPVYSVRSPIYDNVRVEVDIVRDEGPKDNYFGLICRFQNGRNYYRFVVGRDGYYNIGKKQDGQFIDLGSGVDDNAFNQGEGVNRIRADCNGSALALYLNGKMLLAVEDETFEKGSVGLAVGTRNDKGAEIDFDNFAIAKP